MKWPSWMDDDDADGATFADADDVCIIRKGGRRDRRQPFKFGAIVEHVASGRLYMITTVDVRDERNVKLIRCNDKGEISNPLTCIRVDYSELAEGYYRAC